VGAGKLAGRVRDVLAPDARYQPRRYPVQRAQQDVVAALYKPVAGPFVERSCAARLAARLLPEAARDECRAVYPAALRRRSSKALAEAAVLQLEAVEPDAVKAELAALQKQ